MGEKLFAIPWSALRLDPERNVFILDVDREVLEEAPGFDKDDWPRTADREYVIEIYDYYGYDHYW